MTAILIALVQVTACFGFGAAGLRVLGIGANAPAGERHIYAFTLGMGFIGWLIFFIGTAGYLGDMALFALLAAGVVAAVYCRSDLAFAPKRPEGLIAAGIMALLFFTGMFDLLEAFTPPGDSDTLAYHFALPKLFLAAGQIEFVPRALDGAISMLVQMTYVPVLGLGGETALLLWVFASGWMAVYAVYVMARRHLDVNWSLAVALILATTPAVVYGAGGGMVEIRNLLFVLSAMLALTAIGAEKSLSWPLLVGIFAGFFVGGKYLGLLFAAVCGLAVLWERRRLVDGVVFAIGVLIAGSQWYAWNAFHIGDPLFPMLFEWLGTPGTPYWDSEHQQFLRDVFLPSYQVVPADLFWLLAYPFKATLAGEAAFSSGRTGLGPIVLLLLPFAVAAAWTFRNSIRRGPLLTYALVVLIFYVIWFFSGSPQRVRFLLPVYPLLLVVVIVAAARIANTPLVSRPLFLAVSFTIAVQLGGQVLYNLKAAKFVFGQETRQEFLLRTVTNFAPVPWINENLPQGSKVLSPLRYYLYYFDVPYFYAHPVQQAQVNLLPDADDPALFIRQIRNLGITHLLLPELENVTSPGPKSLGGKALVAGCLVLEKSFSTTNFASRTLPSLGETRFTSSLYRRVDAGCPY